MLSKTLETISGMLLGDLVVVDMNVAVGSRLVDINQLVLGGVRGSVDHGCPPFAFGGLRRVSLVVSVRCSGRVRTCSSALSLDARTTSPPLFLNLGLLHVLLPRFLQLDRLVLVHWPGIAVEASEFLRYLAVCNLEASGVHPAATDIASNREAIVIVVATDTADSV